MDLLGLDYDSLLEMDLYGEAAFRKKQLFQWFHEKGVDYDQMHSLPKALRQRLAEDYPLPALTLEKVFTSQLDDTQKLLYLLADGSLIEVVLMKYSYGWTICLPSQVGCAMGCNFCASTLGGLVRNLTRSEMLRLYYLSRKRVGEIQRVVLMGSGEPLDNYDEVLGFIKLLTDPRGRDLSARHITLSTCGLVPEIQRLSKENIPLTLALSLHAPNDDIRTRIMPIARRYPIEDVLEALKEYRERTGRRVSIEYTLISGTNDHVEHARELAERLKGMDFHVNLIPLNPVEERKHETSIPEDVHRFKKVLEDYGINVTIRRELGSDISGSCGQLRNRYKSLEKRSVE